MIQKVKSLVGQIDCPHCFSLLQWNNKEDVHVSNGNKYVICPECGQHIILDKFRDYWIDPTQSERGDSSTESIVIALGSTSNDPLKLMNLKTGESTQDYSLLNLDLTNSEALLPTIFNRHYFLNIHEAILNYSDINFGSGNNNNFILELTFSTFRSQDSTTGLKTEYNVRCIYDNEGQVTRLTYTTSQYLIQLVEENET